MQISIYFKYFASIWGGRLIIEDEELGRDIYNDYLQFMTWCNIAIRNGYELE